MKIRALILAVCIVLLTCFPVYAERSMTFGVWTQHYSGDHTEGLDNHLLALDWEGPTAAFFRNSYGKETGFLGWTWHTDKFIFADKWFVRGNVSAGALVGYGTKHPIHYGALSPGVYPTVDVGRDKFSVGIGVMPTFWWTFIKVEF